MPRPCRACGLPGEADGLCPECRPAAPFLAENSRDRLAALRRARAEDRPAVLLAALRGGARLWEGSAPDGTDLAEAILLWLVRNRPTIDFLRWLAEDARHGHLAVPALARDRPELALQRAPLWLAPGRPAARPGALFEVWRADLRRQLALGFRIGSHRGSRAWEDGIAAAAGFPERLIVRWAIRGGHRRPSPDAFPPDMLERAAGWRRWPPRRFERDRAGRNCIVYCVRCGEFADHGPCGWCGADPELPGLRLLGTAAVAWEERGTCPDCGIDLTLRVVPQQCPGCGRRLDWSRRSRPAEAPDR